MNVRNMSPFPNMRDPVTGEWLPESYSSEKARLQAAYDEQKTRQASRQASQTFAKMIFSLFK